MKTKRKIDPRLVDLNEKMHKCQRNFEKWYARFKRAFTATTDAAATGDEENRTGE